MAKMNSVWNTDQKKYILKRASSLLKEIGLIIIRYAIDTLVFLMRKPARYLWSQEMNAKWHKFYTNIYKNFMRLRGYTTLIK